MEIEYNPEDNEEGIQIESKPKLIKKTQLGKKRLLNSNKIIIREDNDIDVNIPPENDIKEEVIIIKKDVTHINRNQKDNNASFLIKTVLKAFYLSVWKRKVKSLKYYTRSYNPQRVNLRKLIKQISSVIKQHKFDYFNEMCSNMDNLPMPNHVIHDVNFGKIRIIDKQILSQKYTDKITILAENNYYKKINDFKFYLMEAFKKMNQNRERNGQLFFNEKRETDYSNFDIYASYHNTQISKNEFNDLNKNNNNIKQDINEQYYDNNENYENEINNNEGQGEAEECEYIEEEDNYNNQKNYKNIDNNNYSNENTMNNINYSNDNSTNNNKGYMNDDNNYVINNNRNIDDNNYIINNNNYIISNKEYIYEKKDTEDNNQYTDDNNNYQDSKNEYININEYREVEEVEDINNNNEYIERNKNNKINYNNNLENNSEYKENDYNNNDYIESSYNYNYENDYNNNEDIKENNYNNNDYIEDEYTDNIFKESNYEKTIYENNNYSGNNYDNSNYNNITNNYNDYEYNNYEDEYINNDYEDPKYNNDYIYEMNNNYNNYSMEGYDNDYMINNDNNDDNMQYNDEENYYYEEPMQNIERSKIVYYIPYNSNIRNDVRYLSNEGNKVIVNDVYRKPNIIMSNNIPQIRVFSNSDYSGLNNMNNYNYYKEYQIKDIENNNYRSVKKYTRAFPKRNDNHSLYISK